MEAIHLARTRLFPFVLALLLVACASQPTGQASVNKKYTTAWSAQLEKYRADFGSKDSVIRAEVAKGFGPDLTNASDPWQVVVSRVFELSSMIRDCFTIAGRMEVLKAFIAHMESNPTPGLSDIWFQQQAANVQNEARSVDAKTNVFLQNFNSNAQLGANWFSDVDELARAQGLTEGKIEELRSLYKQAESYYRDAAHAKSEAQYQAEQQARTAQSLMATWGMLNQMNYQQQMINTLNRPRTCSFFANSMTCQ